MLRRVALLRTEVSEELIASIIMVTRICELGITLAVTSNQARCKEIPQILQYISKYAPTFPWQFFALQLLFVLQD
jgi:hypothetical protein